MDGYSGDGGMTTKRAPGGGRKPLSPDEPTVELRGITLPQSLKTALIAYAQMRSSQEHREVTISELIRNVIPWIINGMTPEDEANRRMANQATPDEE